MSSNGRSSGGRGGRGTGNNRSRKGNRSGNANKTKKTLQEHIYHLGTASQASDYVTITDFILNHIKKTYVNGDDIADASKPEKSQISPNGGLREKEVFLRIQMSNRWKTKI